MAKFRHLAFLCDDPVKVAEFLHEAFDFDILYTNVATVVSDGEINLTLLPQSFRDHEPGLDFHFGIEMSDEEMAARTPKLEALGATLKDGVRDGRPVEKYLHTPEGHRIDLAPFWPTKPGQHRRDRGEAKAEAAVG